MRITGRGGKMIDLCEICIYKDRFKACQKSACPTAHSYPVKELSRLLDETKKELEELKNESITYGHLCDAD